MEKKKFFANAAITLTAFLAIVIGAHSLNRGNLFIVQGEFEPYSIVLDTNKNKLADGLTYPSGYSGSSYATTELGNEVAFDYSLLINPTTYWQTIKAGGYITNTEPINGMTEISITKYDSSASFKLYWSNNNIFDEIRSISYSSESSLDISFDFGNYLPNYIKIYAVEDSAISSASITFSCSSYYVEKGNTYQFGSYPQSEVTDSLFKSTLNLAAGTLPTAANSQAWTSYGYYINATVSSFMWYIDLENGEDEYRGVYFTSYRPYSTSTTSSTDNSYQDDNGYSTSNVYWFKYEPITWRVLDVQSDEAFLMADLVLDSQDFHYSISNRTIGETTVYANNYEHSHVRSWLNDSFYNTAFDTIEQARIITTDVDNSSASTGFASNQYACANTNDKVFLLSYLEVTNGDYGLGTDIDRQLQTSAYAKSQGLRTDAYVFWWLRSPLTSLNNYARVANIYGSVTASYGVTRASFGMVPALWISL